jgi:hypothetical protein
VDYNAFVNALNWRDHPLERLSIPESSGNPQWFGNDARNQIPSINVQALVSDLTKKPSAQ